ncbi:MAG: hypothetical protein AB1305_04330 [Candidatus Hadarchaeota archaeon]
MTMLDQKGVEPLAMKIFAGIVLLVIGIGVGYGVYTWAGKGTTSLLSFNVYLDGQSTLAATLGRPASGENTRTITVTVESISTYDKSVSLSYTGAPTGVNISFSTSSDKPNFGSTMTVRVDNTAGLGTSTITIRGTSTDTEKTAYLELTVT